MGTDWQHRGPVRSTHVANAIGGKSALSKTFLKYYLHSLCGHLLKTNAFGESGNQEQPLGGSKICVICLVLYLLTHCFFSEGQSLEICEIRGKQDTHLLISQSSTDYLVWRDEGNGLRPAKCIYGSESTSATKMGKTRRCDFWGGHL